MKGEDYVGENQDRKRLYALIISGIFFVGIVPFLCILLALFIDALLNFPILFINLFNLFIALPVLSVGFLWEIWANIALYREGKGSPVPTSATETIRLVEIGPYRFSRNPMIFGYILMFIGLGILFNSLSLLVIISPIILGLLILYVKFREEVDLELRFGEAYKKYKKRKSFIIPCFPEKKLK